MNLQNIPSRLKDIRKMFKAGKDRVFINCDFSKQEPCILASTCQDPDLVEAFHSGLDIYSKIASMMFGVSYDDCLEHYPDGTINKEGKERRSAAKKVVLALLYAKGVKTLAEDLHSTIDKAQEIYDAVLNAFPVMAQWMKKVVKKAFREGKADNLFGRRRRLPNLLLPKYDFIFPEGTEERTEKYYSTLYTNRLRRANFSEERQVVYDDARRKGVQIINNEPKIAEAYREIVNFYIQGGAAVVTMRAMRNIHNNKRLKELGCILVMSIHDETMCSVPKNHAYECAKLIEQCSKDAGNGLVVPLQCDVEIAENWYGEPLKFDENHNLVPMKEK